MGYLQLFAHAGENSPVLAPVELEGPSPNHPGKHLTAGEYYNGWRRALKAAGAAHVGTHGIRHRSATDIANSGIPVKVGMALTAHKTVAMFMRYVHTEDDPVRRVAEVVANRRKTVIVGRQAIGEDGGAA